MNGLRYIISHPNPHWKKDFSQEHIKTYNTALFHEANHFQRSTYNQPNHSELTLMYAAHKCELCFAIVCDCQE